MKTILSSPIRHMVQGLAQWMAYRNEMSNIQLIEADAIFVAADMLRALLPGYIVEREITKTSLPIVNGQRIDLGIRTNNSYECLIEFKLADATNAGYVSDVEKLSRIKQQDPSIDCLVVVLYRKSCGYNTPSNLVDDNGFARRGIIKIGSNKIPVKVRRVCNSFASSKPPKSQKTICLEVI